MSWALTTRFAPIRRVSREFSVHKRATVQVVDDACGLGRWVGQQPSEVPAVPSPLQAALATKRPDLRRSRQSSRVSQPAVRRAATCEYPCVIGPEDGARTVNAAKADDKALDRVSSMTIRHADLSGPDGEHVGRLIGAYLRQTEREKADHLKLEPPADELPERYRAEVQTPAQAFAGAIVLVAELDGAPVGVAVIHRHPVDTEIKRLWTDSQVRGQGVGSALLDAVLAEVSGTIILTVWSWRMHARKLYESRGFTVVPSWEDRADLVCMRHGGGTVA